MREVAFGRQAGMAAFRPMGAYHQEGEEERRWREAGAILRRRLPDFYANLVQLAEVTIATLPCDSVLLHVDMSESNIPG